MIPGAVGEVLVEAPVGVEVGGDCGGEGCVKSSWDTTTVGAAGAGAGFCSLVGFDGGTDGCGTVDDEEGNEMIKGTSVEDAAAIVEDCFDTNEAGFGCATLLGPAGVG